MISACLISRKEDQESLENAISSIIDYVDEVILVDTTEDGHITLPIENKKIKHIPFTWNGSFADARNFSFEQAAGNILFWIDSDDTVVNPQHIPTLATYIESGTADWIYLEYIYATDSAGNIIAKHWKNRMMRKGTGKWVGSVHEDFMPSQAVIQKKDSDLGKKRVFIEHHATEKELTESSRRNLAIQLSEIARDGERVDPRTIQYTAMSYQGLGEFEDAIPYFLQHAKITGSLEDKFWSLYRASMCLHLLHRNNEAINLALESLKLYPAWKSSYFLLAAIYFEQEDWPRVIEWTLTGLEKDDPDTLQVVSEIDYTLLPLGRLSMAYLHTGNYELALSTAKDVLAMNPAYPGSKDLVKSAQEAVDLERFVKSFMEVVNNIRKFDRIKAATLFDLIPKDLDDDYRIQQLRNLTVPPKNWPDKSIVIYCGKSLEEWAYPSIFSGIGGSEEAVIQLSKELAKSGYSVTVYNRCGNMKGVYDGVEYRPYYHFNPKDLFDTLIVWRNPLVFAENLHANKKYLWLHDIAHPEHFNKSIYDSIDKILFLSQWHRTNLPDCPEEKVYITNNGIDPSQFSDLPPKRPHSLIWSSSYDRGLLPFIKNILPLIKKEVPDVTLDVAYGWGNIQKEMEVLPHLKELYNELDPLLQNTPGIVHHHRLSHLKLAKLMGECMVYPYATEFGETCNITSQKCQAAGCYVITTTTSGGTPERILYGEVVSGENIYTSQETQKRFADNVITALNGKRESEASLADIHQAFSWKTTAANWISDLL